MKKLKLLLALCTTFAITLRAAPVRMVMTDTNGAIVYPTNFANANGLARTNAIRSLSRNVVFVSAAYGSDVTGERENPEKQFATIQAGTDAALDGDAVYGQDGTFQEIITCKSNVSYYFASGVVLTNVGTNALFIVTNGPVSIDGDAVLKASGFCFNQTHDVTVKCRSVEAGTAFNLGFGSTNHCNATLTCTNFSASYFWKTPTGTFDLCTVNDAIVTGGDYQITGDIVFNRCEVDFSLTAIAISTSATFNQGTFSIQGGVFTSNPFNFHDTKFDATSYENLLGAEGGTITGTFYTE